MINIEKLIAPKATDKQYTYNDVFRIANILRLDSYKFGHPFAFPENIEGMASYGTARVSHNETIQVFGPQMYVKRYLTQPITMADVEFAEQFAIKHFGRPLFFRKAWERIVREFGGLLPIVIRCVPEGTPIPGGLPVYSVIALGKDFHWLSTNVETALQRAVWYPSTIASLDRETKIKIKQFYVDTGADLAMLPFALHDFAGRGVTCAEQAEIGGAAHTVNFMGSDTVEGILAANFFYHCDMAAFSVYATEHTIECSFGLGTDEEVEYLRHQLRKAKELGVKIMSIVIDGRDVYRAANTLCTTLKQEIIDSGIKVVFRPDSGDMIEVVTKIIRMQDKAFGHTINAKGFKKINYVGIIQGDGVDRLSILTMLGHLESYGYAADNIVFGSGGGLLQKVNRDTFKWAQKGSAILVRFSDGTLRWVGIAKDPVTDPGKRSEEGVLTTVRDKITGEMRSFRLEEMEMPDNLEDIHQLIYYYGKLYNETTLEEVRTRGGV